MYFMSVSRKVKECSKKFYASRKIEGCFNGVLSGFQRVQWVFEGSFQGVSKILQESFKSVSRRMKGMELDSRRLCLPVGGVSQ